MIEWDLYKEQVFDKDGQEVCLHATIPISPQRTQYPGRALIHVFNNPFATEGYLSWGYRSNQENWTSLHPINTYKSKFCIFRWSYLYL